MNKRLFIIFMLGFSSGLPLALAGSTLQAWFADAGMSIMATGALTLVGLPYLYRVVWGPLLDRYTLFSLGKRRSWILTMQLCLVLGFIVLSFCTPRHSAGLMAVIALVIACLSATQDVAIDAHRVEFLPITEHALGASLAVFGYRLAMLLSGGFALVFAQHYGWALTYQVMGLLMLPGIISVLWSSEPSIEQTSDKNIVQSYWAPVKELIGRQGFISLLLFIFFYKLGEAFTATTSGIVMPFLIQGVGFSLETIGYVNKMMGIGSILLGGLVAGIILMRYSLYRSLLIFGVIQALTNLLFLMLAIYGKHLSLLMLAVVSDNFAAGMGSTALVAFFMRIVDKRFTATQFSLLVSLSSLPRIISGPLAASIQLMVGWVGLYQIAIVLSFFFIPFLLLFYQKNKTFNIKEQPEVVF